ncbi:MAG: leucine-rich repeat domain-containing protein [Clostridiales bacterium]|nr:leucine-rich repeat domain-containing protein [Clostridiales bacterium]
MRKRFIAVFVAVMLLGCLPGAAEAEEAAARETLTSGDWEYSLLEDGSADLVHYNGPAGDIVIPNELDGHPVMGVSANLFWNLSDHYTVAVSQSHPYLATIDGVLFGKTDRKLICYPSGRAAASYEIPQGILEIGNFAFCKCDNLTSVTIPDSVTSIGNFTFCRCDNLTSITIPDSVTGIGESAFLKCSNLTKAAIPNSVTSIGDLAFSECGSLTDVTIPESVTSIGRYAFYECSSLMEMTIPNSVISVEQYAFADCSSLMQIFVSEDNLNYCQLDGILFDRDMQTLICYPAGKAQAQYNIPNCVTSIGYGAFMGCKNLKNVTIPDSVTNIGNGAFWGCRNLKDVIIPDSVTSIEEYAFSNCRNLTVVVNAGSYAEQYCRENKCKYAIYDPNLEDAPTDWLTGTP